MTLKGRILRPELRGANGYHVVHLRRDGIGRKQYVHRLVLMAFVGEPAEGQEACHGNDIRTDNRLENLRWDSHRANVADTSERDRWQPHNRYLTHCRRGHAFSKENTIVRPGGRSCRQCKRLTEHARYHKGKEAGAQYGTRADLRKTHCARGHLMDDANTYTRPNGKRNCRTCKRMKEDAWCAINRPVKKAS